MKACTKCGEQLPLTEFFKHKSSADGHQHWCKRCYKAYANDNREAANERSRKYGRANYKQRVVTHAKSRAKRIGVAFDLTVDDIFFPAKCPALGLTLVYETRDGRKNRDDAPSLDRIDPCKGYVKGNVQIISLRANRIKNDATIGELRLLADFMEAMYA